MIVRIRTWNEMIDLYPEKIKGLAVDIGTTYLKQMAIYGNNIIQINDIDWEADSFSYKGWNWTMEMVEVLSFELLTDEQKLILVKNKLE